MAEFKFVAFNPHSRGGRLAGPPAISVQKNGAIYPNVGALRLLLGRDPKPGEVLHIHLLLDADQPDIFAVEAKPEPDDRTYTLRISKKGNPNGIGGRLFARHARLDISSTKRHPCKLLQTDGRRLLVAKRTEFRAVSRGE